jgi:hypothetical protein
MAKKKELYVYHDPNYNIGKANSDGNWITSEVSRKIVAFLRRKGFKRLKAGGLSKKMLSVVKREEEGIVVIVFAQDVAPNTALDDAAPTALIRQYLDNGGSIVWIGDIPFWDQATWKGQNRNYDWWRSGAAANILGVNPVFPTQISKAKTKKITIEHKTFELKSAWTGIRPVLIDKTIKVLAEAECPISSPHQPIPLSRLSRLWNSLSGVGIGAGTIRIDVRLEIKAQPENILLNKKLANGWFKNFDSANLRSGFFRIWDYIPAALNNEKLDELYNVAKYAGGEEDTD